jgi:hypothetical protein
MKRLLHPLAMPFYSFALFIELERQSYSIQFAPVAMLVVMMVCMIMLAILIVQNTTKSESKTKSTLSNNDATIASKITEASLLSVAYIVATYQITQHLSFYTWGAHCIYITYILPTWLNILSGKSLSTLKPNMQGKYPSDNNIAPPAYIGTLTGFTIMIGHKTSADTFWPFTISLLLFTLWATFCNKTKLSHSIYSYLLGTTQSILIMYTAA